MPLYLHPAFPTAQGGQNIGSAFCAEVDQFAGLSVSDTTNYTTATAGTNLQLFGDVANFVDGSTTAPLSEQPFAGEAYSQAKDKTCTLAFASNILLNITLDAGVWKEQDGVSKVGTGFVATCDKDSVCGFDVANAYCLGPNKGAYGYCAYCSDQTDYVNKKPLVFVSWYGTDSAGVPMTSNSKNPTNFQQFSIGGFVSMFTAAKNAAQTAADEANSLKDTAVDNIPDPSDVVPS